MPFVTADRTAERDAFLRLALGRRSRAHRSRQLAREAEASGDLALYREWTADAKDMWAKAKRSLDFARREAAHVENFNAQDH